MTYNYQVEDSEAASGVFVLLSAIFFTAAVLVIVFLLLSRLVKDARQKRVAALLSVLQSSLNGILFHESDSPVASYQFHLDEIRNIIAGKRLATQVLIDHIVNLKKSLTGSPAKTLEKIYNDLGLHIYSTQKLSSFSWNRRAQGLRELSELNNRSIVKTLPVLLATRNRTLREELLLSMIRLDSQNPLDFLDEWDGEITSWMRIHIHHYLSQLDVRTLPDFSKWFSSERDDVVVFAISMARQFQQSHTETGLVKLLIHSNVTVVVSAIRALTELESFAVVDKVIAIAEQYRNNEKVSTAIVQYLAKTVHDPEHLLLLESYLHHDALGVRLEAVRALMILGPEGATVLQHHVGADNPELQALISHASEPLLR